MVAERVLPVLAGIVVAGVAAQWLAWRVRLPSILLLLLFGLIAGPLTGWVDPDALFGDLLFPLVSLSVGLILYEGGLTLKMSELPRVGAAVRNLVSVGALVTWGVTSLSAHVIVGLSPPLSALVGAVLVVTGPTVIAPLLRHIRPTGAVGPVLRWEGIVIDPIGALLTVLVFEVILIGEAKAATAHIAFGVGKTLVLGGGLGFFAAAFFVVVLERFWVADYLHNAVSLMLVVGTFAVSNALQHESGLLAVTVMGFVLANQKRADVEHIVEFTENLRELLISGLFIVLAARVEIGDLKSVAVSGGLFVAVLVCVGRPLSVLVSTLRTPLALRERVFMSWMAPRGIVAAAISSVLAMRLEDAGMEGARLLVPLTFLTIIATVAIYSLTGPLLARKLGVAEADPQGVLFAGAHAWARAIGARLQDAGFRVLMVDSNRANIAAARMAGLPTYGGSILAEHTLDELELGGIGRLLAVTPNDWVNVLTVRRFERVFGRSECYQLAPQQDTTKKKAAHKYLHGRWFCGEKTNFGSLSQRMGQGFSIKATDMTEEFDFDAYRARYGPSALSLFVIDADNRLRIAAADSPLEPVTGETLVGFVRDDPQTVDAAASD